MHQKAYFLADGIFGRSKSNMCFKMPKNNGHYGAILLHKTSPFPDARITIALMLLEQYSKLFTESDQGDFRTIGGAKYCLSAKITFRILRITAYTIVCR